MKTDRINNFTDLIVWQEAHKLAIFVYKQTEGFPKHELFGLVSQLRRAAVSVTSNIAEGFSRHSSKEKVQFYSMAHGSITEIENQLLLARDVGYLDSETFDEIRTQLLSVHKLINAYIRSTHSRF